MPEVSFWDVDTQVDFMLPGRPLHVRGAEEILAGLRTLTHAARESGIRILGSEDSHGMEDAEISREPDWVLTYPPHCLAGTEGQRRVAETRPLDPLYVESPPQDAAELAARVRAHRGEVFFRKQSFDVFSNPNVEPVLELLAPEAIVIYGVALDVCVRQAVEGFLRRGRAELRVVSDAVRALQPARGDALLAAWRERGVRTPTIAEVLAGLAVAHRAGAA